MKRDGITGIVIVGIVIFLVSAAFAIAPAITRLDVFRELRGVECGADCVMGFVVANPLPDSLSVSNFSYVADVLLDPSERFEGCRYRFYRNVTSQRNTTLSTVNGSVSMRSRNGSIQMISQVSTFTVIEDVTELVEVSSLLAGETALARLYCGIDERKLGSTSFDVMPSITIGSEELVRTEWAPMNSTWNNARNFSCQHGQFGGMDFQLVRFQVDNETASIAAGQNYPNDLSIIQLSINQSVPYWFMKSDHTLVPPNSSGRIDNMTDLWIASLLNCSASTSNYQLNYNSSTRNATTASIADAISPLRIVRWFKMEEAGQGNATDLVNVRNATLTGTLAREVGLSGYGNASKHDDNTANRFDMGDANLTSVNNLTIEVILNGSSVGTNYDTLASTGDFAGGQNWNYAFRYDQTTATFFAICAIPTETFTGTIVLRSGSWNKVDFEMEAGINKSFVWNNTVPDGLSPIGCVGDATNSRGSAYIGVAYDAGYVHPMNGQMTEQRISRRRMWHYQKIAYPFPVNVSALGAVETSSVGNSVPTLSQVNLTGVVDGVGVSYVFGNGTVFANVTYTDADGDPGNVTFVWYRNGTTVHMENFTAASASTINATLAGSNFSHYDLINVTVRVRDSQGNQGVNVTGRTLNISNSPPRVVSIMSHTANATAFATRTPTLVFNATDPDGDDSGNRDNLTYIIQVSDVTDFSNVLRNLTNHSGSVQPSSAFPDGMLFYRVNSTDGQNGSSMGNYSMFIVDTLPPSVFVDVNASNATNVNRSPLGSVSIRANVSVNITDSFNVSVVLANITWPNLSTSLNQLLLVNTSTNDTYFLAFNDTPIEGLYNVTFIANDSRNQVNRSTVTNFSVRDVDGPTFANISVSDNGTAVGGYNLSVNVTDYNRTLGTVTINVTRPGRTDNFTMLLASPLFVLRYNFTPSETMTVNATVVANDSRGNAATLAFGFVVIPGSSSSGGGGGGGGSPLGTGTLDLKCALRGLVAKSVNGSMTCVTLEVAMVLDAVQNEVIKATVSFRDQLPTIIFIGIIVVLLTSFAGVTKRRARKRREEEAKR